MLQSVLMGVLSLSGQSVPAMLEQTMTSIYKPAVKAVSSWGELDKSPSDQQVVRTFLDRFDAFISALRGMDDLIL